MHLQRMWSRWFICEVRRKPQQDALALFDALVYTCHYRSVIEPVSHLRARVLEWRQQLREHIGMFNEAYQMPGIALLECELPPEYERPLVEAMERGCEGFASFTLNYGALMHTEDRKCIYIDLMEKGTVAAMRQRVVDHVRANKRINKLGVHVVDQARLVIASGLKVAQFNSAWPLLANQPIAAQQRVSDVVCMKRELDATSIDQHLRTFALSVH